MMASPAELQSCGDARRRGRRRLRALAMAASGLWWSMSAAGWAADLVLSDFNGTGFTYTITGFDQTIGANSVRVHDPADDSGGAGLVLSPTLDLSSHANSYFVVDMFTNPGNQVDAFDLELIDASDPTRTGKWTFNVSDLPAGVPATLTSTTTLANPTHGIGDFTNLDLANIETLQVLGTFSAPAAFDINFDRILVSDSVTPPPPYAGAEPDAPWRTEAAARIEANRKANLQVNVADALGNAVTGANVEVNMKQHEFGFGSAVVGFRLSDNNPTHATYKQKVAELFNIATLENTLKWEALAGEFGGNFSQTIAQEAVTWLAEQDIKVRGHNLIWPGADNLPDSIANLVNSAPLNPAEQQQLRNEIAAHIADVGGAFAGQLAAWDVINEERTNHDVMDALAEGDLAMVDWFHQARAADAAAKLYINDFGILNSAGSTNTINQQTYYDAIEFLQNNNAPIDGIGFQGHFVRGDLTGPVEIWAILDRFQQLGLDMQITEFDFTTTDQQLQADYTRDFLTALFAHEGVDDFLFWGFWEDAHWRPDAALFNSDWSIKPNGQAFVDLIFGQWWTDEALVSGVDGAAELRGFKGEYEVTVTHNGQTEIVTATLTEGGLLLDVALSNVLSADFEGDGDVDGNDLSQWEEHYGVASAAVQNQGDANGDGNVDGQDFLQWQRQKGTTAGPPIDAIPEPSTIAMTLAIVLPLAITRFRGRLRTYALSPCRLSGKGVRGAGRVTLPRLLKRSRILRFSAGVASGDV